MAFEKYAVEYSIEKFISHCGQTADPLNKFSKALKNISGNRKKTDEDHAAMAKIEAEAGLYLDEDTGLVTISTHVLEAAILEGAKKTKEGKISLSACWVDSSTPIEFDGSTKKKPLTVKEIINDERYRRVDAVRVGQAKIMRTRPYFKNVKGSFVVSLDTEAANFDQLQRWIIAAFNQVGLGDWRPRYGRGQIISIKKLKD